jgi:hypothetical protein
MFAVYLALCHLHSIVNSRLQNNAEVIVALMLKLSGRYRCCLHATSTAAVTFRGYSCNLQVTTVTAENCCNF